MKKCCQFWHITHVLDSFEEEATEIGYTHPEQREAYRQRLEDRLENVHRCNKCEACFEEEAELALEMEDE